MIVTANNLSQIQSNQLSNSYAQPGQSVSPRVDTKKRKGPKINVKSMMDNELDKS